MQRGDVYWADLDPVRGSEASQRRPVVIVSNNPANRASPNVTICAITSSVHRLYSFDVMLPDGMLEKPSKIQSNQIRTVSKERLDDSPVAQLDEADLELLNHALKLHLDLI